LRTDNIVVQHVVLAHTSIIKIGFTIYARITRSWLHTRGYNYLIYLLTACKMFWPL